MPQGPLPLVLWALTFISASETCSLRSRITAVEGEPLYLKYCSPFKNEETPAPVKWYKSNVSHGRVELSSSSTPRIEMYDYVLEFWPIELEDVGSYCLQIGNDTREWTVNVTRRSKHSCFAEKQVNSKEVEVRNALRISCKHGYYQKRVNRTLLYQNCEKIKDNKTPPLQKNAEFEDQGYYTCVFFLHHNGKLFNVTNTLKITVVGDHSSVMPVLLGPKLNRVGVDLGTDVQLNCSAVLNEKDMIYWNFWKENGEDPNVHEEEEIRIKTPEGKWHASKILRIENVGENNLNFLYNCSAVSEAGTDTNSFILLRKEDLVDIPSHVFTRGMVTAVLVSVAVVGLVTLGVAHRVDLALFYRRFTGRDETLTDGKTYDAFVSYLKDCPAGRGDEHAFAVETLPAVLEKHFGYKLCIFERDVVPGGAVVDEIHSLIEKSRRLIIVLSPGYVSNAVRYELESGLHEALVGRKIKVILIEFTPLSDFTFLPQSLKLLKSHRVLKWKAEKSLSYNSRFWKNLLYLMPAKSTVRPCRGELEALDVLPES